MVKIGNLFFKIIIYSFFLSACGFKSLYNQKDYSHLDNNLNAIEIEFPSTIEGQEFYHSLSSILPKKSSIRYILKVNFSSHSFPLAIQRNSDTLIQSIQYMVEYKLFDINTKTILTSGQLKQFNSYNTTFSPYATSLEQLNAAENLARFSAEEIRNRLVLYFENLKR